MIMNIDKDSIKGITIYEVIVGSNAYGFSSPDSDLDIRGMAIPPKEYFLGFCRRFEQYEDSVNDIVIYNIQKYFQLARAVNPNIIELIFIDNPNLIKLETVWSRMIKDCRNEFLSMKCRHTFSGYAFAQLNRIKVHKKWIDNPPDHKPIREEFGLKPDEIISFSQLQAVRKVVETGHNIETMAMQLIQKETSYKNALNEWQDYQTWLRTRNPKRADIEKQWGYDCKHACHLVRLLRMGYEILSEGRVIVERPDAVELRSIRNGAWSYEKVLDYAQEMDSKMQELYNHPEKCAVPYAPNDKILDSVLIDIIEGYWKHG